MLDAGAPREDAVSPVAIPGAIAAWIVAALAEGVTSALAAAVTRSTASRRRRRLIRMAVVQTMAGSYDVWWTTEQLLYALSEQQIESNLLELQDALRRLARLERARTDGYRWAMTVQGFEYAGALQDLAPDQRFVIDGEE